MFLSSTPGNSLTGGPWPSVANTLIVNKGYICKMCLKISSSFNIILVCAQRIIIVILFEVFPHNLSLFI